MKIEVQNGASVVIRATIKSTDGFNDPVLANPSSVTVTITDSAGTEILGATAMTTDATGYYYYNWVSSGSGFMTVLINAVAAYPGKEDDRTLKVV